MVEFGKTNYFHAMDNPLTYPLENMSIKEFGSSAGFGDVLQKLKGEVMAGASHVELVFTGAGKGSLGQGATTPEMFDNRKREEIRQLAKINEVSLSTHHSIRLAGVSGWDQQQNKFSDTAAKESLVELKRTIDFAADAAGGGAIVVHTSEFPREIKDKRFLTGEKGKEIVYLADKKSGQIVGFRKDQEIRVPEWKRDSHGNYVNAEGKPITFFDYKELVPQIDDRTGEIKWRKDGLRYEDIEKEVSRWNEKHYKKEDHKDAAKEFLFWQHIQQVESEMPRAWQHFKDSQTVDRQSQDLLKAANTWKVLEEKTPADKKEYLIKAFKDEFGEAAYREMVRREESPSEWLKSKGESMRGEANRLREGYVGFQRQVDKVYKDKESFDSIEKVGVEKSAKTFADAAMYAYKLEKEKKLGKELYVAPENMFAEWGYGGHPEELKELITESRKHMAKQLQEQGKSKDEAWKIAEKHIRATFDIGHANTWAKYFQPSDPKAPLEEQKKEFNKWLMGKVKELQKDNIIGHVHMSDNFGYFDEHLNAGQGNAPISDFLKVLKNSNFEGKIVAERGAQGPEEPSGELISAWAHIAGSPMYRVDGIAPRWSDIETGGYFGRASSPRMTVGPYATGLGKDWGLWTYSEAPIE